jgi:class 3 adenylate cyclase/tetratricopeptide (TPR) repeat protein
MSSDLRSWLEKVGLGQYAEVFAANDVDLNVLADLSDEDLKELGVSLGHRRRLQRTVAEQMANALQAPIEGASVPDVAECEIAADTAGRDAERRQLTVLFCDMVGSTELSRRLDPEDLREVIRRYQEAVTDVVVRYGGYVANFLGDGVIVYFGWPRADEDQAGQAIRAGLDAVMAVRGLTLGQDLGLQTRVGISSGMVVVGDLDGGAAGRLQTGAIAGETPNLAARLQAVAEPDQVVIGGLTRQLVGAAFLLEELGPQSLKGIAEPVPAWRVLRERPAESRFDARGGRLTRFIGRDHEVALLIERWERAAAAEGQAVLLSGEAGVGKSRVVQRLREHLSATPHTRLRMQCSPFHTTSALHPVIRQLEHAAELSPEDGPQARLNKLEVLLRRGAGDARESAALLAPLLSLSAAAEDRYGTLELPPEQRKERTLNALIEQLLGLTAREPVLFVLEDAHWIDPTTRELIAKTLPCISDARVLMLVTHRPDFQSDWTRHPHVTVLTLNRLSRTQGAELVRAVGSEGLPEEVVGRIVRRADGVPLFIEEITRSVVEAGDAFGDTDIPETLQGSLLVRLDRLGPDARELAQIAAVIGREFNLELLYSVAARPKENIDRELERLVASQIMLPAAGAGHSQNAVYTFRHALLQDAAYHSLLLSRRRHFHGAIAQALESRFPDAAESQPELVAQHYAATEAPERAILHWRRAGELALARSAGTDAITHFQRGLRLARDLAPGPARAQHVSEMLLALGEACLRLSWLPEAADAFQEAANLARQERKPEDLAGAALGFEEADFLIGMEERASIPLLEEALTALGERQSVARCRLLSRLGRALFNSGAADRATPLMREATELARCLGDQSALFDALICEFITTTGVPLSAERFPERRRTLDEMLALAEAIGRRDLILKVHARQMPACLEMGDLASAEAAMAGHEEMVGKDQVSGFLWLCFSFRAMHAILHGEFAEAERTAERALELGRKVHDEVRGLLRDAAVRKVAS